MVGRHRVVCVLPLFIACSGGGPSASNDGGPPDAALFDPSDAHTIPKFVTSLPLPLVYVPSVTMDRNQVVHEYAIDVRETVQQVLPPGFPSTKVWGYGARAKGADGVVDATFRGWPGATLEATRNVPVRVTFTNHLQNGHMFAVDPTLDWADPNHVGAPSPPFVPYPPGYPSAQSPVVLVTHLHGGQNASVNDGFPLAFFGPNDARTYTYPNTQPATTLWYHDHAFGITRLNVMAGLAGFYLLRDPADPIAAKLPSGAFEIPIAIQDRTFAKDGSLVFPSEGVNPDVHPYWRPELFGDAIVVNGRTWPKLDVLPAAYRFRLLNGSNARFYHLRLVDESMNPITFTQIGSDGGYLAQPAPLDELLLAPGERADVVVDLSMLAGHRLRFVNDANAPYPDGDAPDPATTGQILAITVASATPAPPLALPSTLGTIPALTPNVAPRVVTLYEVEGPLGPLASTLNGQHFGAPASETPRVGSTEDWEIVNLTPDAHPIHLHLVHFQVVRRQPFDADAYRDEWVELNGHPTFPVMTSVKALDPSKYFNGAARGPMPNEIGWKDTVAAMAGEVTTIRIRFAPLDVDPVGLVPGVNRYPFDPTAGPGYVWHCHILDHEDNEMMRPLSITAGP